MWCSEALLDLLLKKILLNLEDTLFLLVIAFLFNALKLFWLHDDAIRLIMSVRDGT